MSILSTIEGAAAKGLSAVLPVMIKQLGAKVNLIRRTINDTDKVYGNFSGTSSDTDVIGTIEILLSNTFWSSLGDSNLGYTEDMGYCYSLGVVNTGDVFELVRADGYKLSFIVTHKQAIGSTQQIVSRLKIEAISD